jgi:hypothetical protein
MIEKILLLALVATIVAVIVIYTTKPSVKQSGKEVLFNLNKNRLVVDKTADTTWKEGPCGLRFGVFIQSAPRTLAKIDCLTPGTSAPTTFAPSCSNSDFSTCSCAGTDCSRCSLADDSSSYYSKLVSYGSLVELWAAGYAAESDKPLVPALLKIKTGTTSGNSQMYMESVPLPAIPLQRWTIITIVKEGRRFDVFYGSKLVSSKLLSYPPIVKEATPGWMAGNPKWQGKIGFFYTINGSWSTADVEEDMDALVNRRGIPFYTESINFNDFKFGIPCMMGECGSLPKVQPTNPFQSWNTSYS